ncbi:MAG: hypothetical protein JSS62_06540 [Verrucomicrobia bacterium]|nr:hypothetical protein [Verrucomicrobiota bacterium]MBS0645694.1 hypothetical protein [Verrucomicrobiota bacterium]
MSHHVGPAPGLLDCCCPADSMAPSTGNRAKAVTSILCSLALATLTAFAAYYCITHGLNGLDHAYTSLALWKFGTLTYVGAAFGLAAIVNAGFAVFGRPCGLKEQTAATIGAPVAMVVIGGWMALTTVVQGKLFGRSALG